MAFTVIWLFFYLFYNILTISGSCDKLIYSLKTSSQDPAFPAAKPANPPSLVLAIKPGSDLGYFLRWVGRILGASFIYKKNAHRALC